MKRTFFLTFATFLFVWAFSSLDRIGFERDKNLKAAASLAALSPEEIQFLTENPTIRTQVEEIDRQITELEAMKRGFEARALRHMDQASRLQFEDRAVLETRRHLELAEENQAKAAKVQDEINRLQAEKNKLLKMR